MLAQKEEQSLEKSLIFEQVQRLLENLQEKQAAAVDDKRVLADQLADTKAKLTDGNRKTIALISEIAMEQSKNLELLPRWLNLYESSWKYVLTAKAR